MKCRLALGRKPLGQIAGDRACLVITCKVLYIVNKTAAEKQKTDCKLFASVTVRGECSLAGLVIGVFLLLCFYRDCGRGCSQRYMCFGSFVHLSRVASPGRLIAGCSHVGEVFHRHRLVTNDRCQCTALVHAWTYVCSAAGTSGQDRYTWASQGTQSQPRDPHYPLKLHAVRLGFVSGQGHCYD